MPWASLLYDLLGCFGLGMKQLKSYNETFAMPKLFHILCLKCFCFQYFEMCDKAGGDRLGR